MVPVRDTSANINPRTVRGNRNTSFAKNVEVLSCYDDAGPNFRLQSTGLFFALKLMYARNARQYKLFVEEVEHMRGFIGVDHVLQIEDYECDAARLRVVILMELATSDLQAFLQGHNWELDAQLISSIFRAIVDAIAVVHERDVIHFDLKPQNFLLVPKRTIACSAEEEKIGGDLVFFGEAPSGGERRDESNSQSDHRNSMRSSTTTTTQAFCLKIGDFGLAHRLLDDATHLSSDLAPGTTAFMAPEALYQPGSKGRKKLTPKVDVWSLGVMLYKMLHRGQTPWEGHRQLGRMELAMAIADPRSRPIFEKAAAWELQRRLLDDGIVVFRTGGELSGQSSPSEEVLEVGGGKFQNGKLKQEQQQGGGMILSGTDDSEDKAKNCRGSSGAGAAVRFSLQTALHKMQEAITAREAVAAHGGQESVPAKAKDHVQTKTDTEAQDQNHHAVASTHLHVAFEGYFQLKMEFLFRVCQKCLEFDVDRRVAADELRDLCRQEGQFAAREFLDAFAEHLPSFQGEKLFPEKISSLRRMVRDVPPFCALWAEDGDGTKIVDVSENARGLDGNGIFVFSA